MMEKTNKKKMNSQHLRTLKNLTMLSKSLNHQKTDTKMLVFATEKCLPK